MAVKITIVYKPLIESYLKRKLYIFSGHGELLELRLLEKSARHDFIIARHHSSNNNISCHLL